MPNEIINIDKKIAFLCNDNFDYKVLIIIKFVCCNNTFVIQMIYIFYLCNIIKDRIRYMIQYYFEIFMFMHHKIAF
jgi:hypothetical protein